MRWPRLFPPLSVLFVAVCGQPATESQETERLRNQVYFTKDDPGRWKDFARDHDPQVKTTTAGRIEVDIPVSAETGHYIEVIVLSDAARQEIAVKTFKRGEKPSVIFSIPPQKMSGLTAIAKCNLHGMWRKEVK